MFLFIVIIFIVTINYTHQYKLDIDCINGNNNGINYNGTVNTTATGHPCIVWKNIYNSNGHYNYHHNYCRNPDNSTVPWCYTDIRGHSRHNCNITYCGHLCPDLSHAPHMIEPTNLDKHHAKDTVTFRCAAGYLLSGDKTATCKYEPPDNMASWTNAQPTCVQNCIKSTTDLNYKGHISTTRHGYTCTYWNTTKYRNEEQNYCRTPSGDLDNGEGPWCYLSGYRLRWDICNIPACPGKSCPNLANHLIPKDRKSIYHYGETVYLSCETGYHLKGDKIISCEQSGQWNATTMPICEAITCTRTSLHLTDGIQVFPDIHRYTFQTTVTMSCTSSFSGTTVTAQCIDVNKWSHTPPMCTKKTCSKTALLLSQNVNITNNKQRYELNEEVTMSCKHGFSGGTVTARCTDADTWSANTPICNRITCTQASLHLTRNINVTNVKLSYNFLDDVKMSCNYGLSGNNVTARCTGLNTWSEKTPTCTKITCDRTSLQLTQNVNVTNDKLSYKFNDAVTMSCNYGFSGKKVTKRCTDVNIWSEKTPNCTRITCTHSSLHLTRNITVTNVKLSYNFLEEVTMSCNYGFSGNNVTARCTGLNTWSQKTPTCTSTICRSKQLNAFNTNTALPFIIEKYRITKLAH